MIGESPPHGVRRSAVNPQARPVPEPNALIAAIHHNKVNWPGPDGIDLRHKDTLAAPTSVLATCFNNHFQLSIMCVQKDARDSGKESAGARCVPIKLPVRI
jgi:hypothetical protein